jgi:hypothetical protein
VKSRIGIARTKAVRRDFIAMIITVASDRH